MCKCRCRMRCLPPTLLLCKDARCVNVNGPTNDGRRWHYMGLAGSVQAGTPQRCAAGRQILCCQCAVMGGSGTRPRSSQPASRRRRGAGGRCVLLRCCCVLRCCAAALLVVRGGGRLALVLLLQYGLLAVHLGHLLQQEARQRGGSLEGSVRAGGGGRSGGSARVVVGRAHKWCSRGQFCSARPPAPRTWRPRGPCRRARAPGAGSCAHTQGRRSRGGERGGRRRRAAGRAVLLLLLPSRKRQAGSRSQPASSK